MQRPEKDNNIVPRTTNYIVVILYTCYTESSILSVCTVIQAVWQVSFMAVEHRSLRGLLHAIIASISLSNMQLYCDLCTV